MTDKTLVLSDEKIHFITGKLAEAAVRTCIEQLAKELGFRFSLQVLPITVAALMTPQWILRHLQTPIDATRLIVPGYVGEGMQMIQDAVACRVELGPKDIRDLPSHFGKASDRGSDYGDYTIEVLGEINYASRYSAAELLAIATEWTAAGANVIDLGCDPNQRWIHVGEAVRALVAAGVRCSIDTFDPLEAEQAARAGAELVLSVNRSNRQAAVDWNCEVVVIPDELELDACLASLEESVDFLSTKGVKFRLDPILEPIGCGFASSLLRYHATRQRFPDARMMMGIGNLTELTDCDSAGVNLLLLALCQEWGIQSVLTTQVIPWARSSIRECDLARRLVAYTQRHRIPPKKIEPGLVMLRDPKVHRYDLATIEALVASIRDNNYRIFVTEDQLHLVSAGVHIVGDDPFVMMDQLMQLPQASHLDTSHAFYLGFELAKALTALTLGKHYDQDVALTWGMHTRPEKHHRLPRRSSKLRAPLLDETPDEV